MVDYRWRPSEHLKMRHLRFDREYTIIKNKKKNKKETAESLIREKVQI